MYEDSRLTVVYGIDDFFGKFYQIFDKELQDETPEGEGLVLDYSEFIGYGINLTGISNNISPHDMIILYIRECTGNNVLIGKISLN